MLPIFCTFIGRFGSTSTGDGIYNTRKNISEDAFDAGEF